MDRQFPDDPRGQDAFKYAFELYLRAIQNFEVAIDGFTLIRIVEEAPSTLRAVGISHILPSGQLPIDAEIRSVDGSVEYRILVGTDDDAWRSLSESGRWKVVYTYATDGTEPRWNWDRPVVGTLDN